MNPANQWGDEMNIKYNPTLGSWTYDCIYGCFEYGFANEDEAWDSFVAHLCGPVVEPCS